MCDVMLALLDSCTGETIDGGLLQGWISSIRTDATIRNTEAQVGSFDVVEYPAALVDPVDRAVWVDCAGMPELHYDFEFLSPDERKGLEGQGVRVWSRTEEMKVELELIRRGVGQVRRELILVTPESDWGRGCGTIRSSTILSRKRTDPYRGKHDRCRSNMRTFGKR